MTAVVQCLNKKQKKISRWFPPLLIFGPANPYQRSCGRGNRPDAGRGLLSVPVWTSCPRAYRGIRLLRVIAEAVIQTALRKRITALDGSAAVTGLLLSMNLPPHAPWWLAVSGSFFAIIIIKQLFGGLGSNIFNPALRRARFSWRYGPFT